MNTKIVKLDINRNLYDTLTAKQGDTQSRFLLFQLLDGAIPFSLENRSVKVFATKPDGKEVFNDLIINDRVKGYCTLELTNQMLAVPGLLKLELMVIEGDKKLTTNVFYMDVKKSINSENAIVSTNEFSALLNGLASLNEYDNYKNEIAAARDGEVNLLTKVKKIDEHLDTKVNQLDLEVERKRIDNFTSLTEGSTTGDAELIDGRISANGYIYPNIGSNVRDISRNMEYIEPINIFNKNSVVENKYIDINGEIKTPIDGGDWCISGLIQIKGGKDIYIKTRTNICFFNSKKEFISCIGTVGTTVNDGIILKETIPLNAVYIIFSIPQNITSSNLNIVSYDKKVDYSNYFEPYYNVVTSKKVNEEVGKALNKIVIKSSNIFNYRTCIENKFVDRNTGNLTDATQDGFYASDWIQVTPSESYFISHLRAYAFYDINKKYISGAGSVSSVTLNQTVIVPSDAKYFRITVHNDYFNKMFINEGDISQGYSPYETINNDLMDSYYNKDEINNIINNNSTGFENKIVNCLGDSITYGYNGAKDGDGVVGERVDKPYPTILSEILNCTVNNYGQNGSTIGGDGATTDEYGTLGYKPMNVRYSNMSNADYVVVFGGTNDCYASGRLPLGAKGDTTNLTFYGSLKILIEGLINKYPTSKICFITPLKRTTISPNSYGKTLIEYANAIIEVCEEYSIPYLDFHRKSGCYPLISAFKNANLPDGLHPNQSYYYIIANKIAEFIKTL